MSAHEKLENNYDKLKAQKLHSLEQKNLKASRDVWQTQLLKASGLFIFIPSQIFQQISELCLY